MPPRREYRRLMPVDPHAQHKAALTPFRQALYNGRIDAASANAASLFSDDATISLSNPFETVGNAQDWLRRIIQPLATAIPDLERRDTIVIAGRCLEEQDWVGCCGYYTGTFAQPWLDIPATGRTVSLRFHEFYRFEHGQVVEVQAIWDVPEVMMQAGCWPMAPSLGRLWHVPGPATQDGLQHGERNQALGDASRDHVLAMLSAMGRHPTEPAAVMDLPAYWHPQCHWYGPAGIGTCRGMEGFRQHHQIPFLAAMPDRHGAYERAGHFFAEARYVGVTGWPNMYMTLSGSDWLGIAGAGQSLSMRSLDFWRIEDGLIRENWVLVDLLHVYAQLGVDVFERMRALGPDHRSS